MRIDFITLFPEVCENFLSDSIIGKARKKGYVQMCFHQLRDFAFDKHKKVDDCPFGGGKGMLLKPEPIAACIEKLTDTLGEKPHIIYMSPRGTVLNQEKVKELSAQKNLCFICGHYEGIDERIIDKYVDEQISIGDYVLTGGEMPAVIVADAVCRMIKGVLSEDVCFTDESHFSGLLEQAQYTRPAVWENMKVPEVLTSGDHKKVEQWKKEKSIELTKKHRPDMWEKYGN
ncbi:MAG: tRNA (guanosine(37)-N1)-methyltransferase TrmD [Clostridia bacterium]